MQKKSKDPEIREAYHDAIKEYLESRDMKGAIPFVEEDRDFFYVPQHYVIELRGSTTRPGF